MKKILCFFLVCCSFLTQSTTVFANTPILELSVAASTNDIDDQSQADCISMNIPLESSDTLISQSKKNITPDINIKLMPNGIIEKDPNSDDSYKEDKPSKWQLVKNFTIYCAKSFVYEVKSFIKFYPFSKIGTFIANCCWFFPTYALYKKTGIDIPAHVSNFMMNHENWSIFIRNLYNVIPMTIASFLYKGCSSAYARMKY